MCNLVSHLKSACKAGWVRKHVILSAFASYLVNPVNPVYIGFTSSGFVGVSLWQ
jgi:hypothetical protein